jgi:hypothetical protein
VLVDVYAKLDFFQFCPGRLLVLVLLGNVVTEFPESDNFTNRWIRRGRDFDHIEAESLSFTQSIRELHDAQLFTGGSQNDPDIAGANPTVYTKLWLQIKSKLLAGETGVCRVVVFLWLSQFSVALGCFRNTLHCRGCEDRGDGPAHFASRGEVVGNISLLARSIS